MSYKAIGLLETYGYIGAVIALDTALKASFVSLLSCEFITGGIVTVTIFGDVASVQSAVDTAKEIVQAKNIAITTHIIPRLSEEAEQILYLNRDIKNSYKVETIEDKKGCITDKVDEISDNLNNNLSDENKISFSKEKLISMKVEELRTLARQINVTYIDRNMIKFARKKELIDAIILTLEGCDDK